MSIYQSLRVPSGRQTLHASLPGRYRAVPVQRCVPGNSISPVAARLSRMVRFSKLLAGFHVPLAPTSKRANSRPGKVASGAGLVPREVGETAARGSYDYLVPGCKPESISVFVPFV